MRLFLTTVLSAILLIPNALATPPSAPNANDLALAAQVSDTSGTTCNGVNDNLGVVPAAVLPDNQDFDIKSGSTNTGGAGSGDGIQIVKHRTGVSGSQVDSFVIDRNGIWTESTLGYTGSHDWAVLVRQVNISSTAYSVTIKIRTEPTYGSYYMTAIGDPMYGDNSQTGTIGQFTTRNCAANARVDEWFWNASIIVPPPPPPPPGAPLLSLNMPTLNGLAECSLTWTTPSGNITGYNVTLHHPAYTETFNVGLTNTFLHPATANRENYTVHAFNSGGNGNESNTVTCQLISNIFGDSGVIYGPGGKAGFAAALGINTQAGGVLWGILLILALIILGSVTLASHNPFKFSVAGGIIGGIVGLLLALAIGMIPFWVIIFCIGIALAVYYMTRGRGSPQ